MTTFRLDNLPMDRQAAGYSRAAPGKGGSLLGPGGLTSVFEKRDVDPESPFFKRRHGSQRITNAAPNLLGVTANLNKGSVDVDASFALTAWTAFGTIRTPLNFEDAYYPIFQFRGVNAYVYYLYSTNVVSLRIYNAAGTLKSTTVLGDIDTAGQDYRFVIRYSGGDVFAVTWVVPDEGDDPTIGSAGAGVAFTLAGNSLSFIGPILSALSSAVAYQQVVLTNFQLYDVSDFDKDEEYETLASDLTPALAGTNDASTAFKLKYHENFTEGGEVLRFEDTDEAEIFSYLVPTTPSDAKAFSEDDEWIHFGGQGVIEIPFYLDFDEYYWTPITASARLDWGFALEIILPKILTTCVIHEFQDIIKLEIIEDSGDHKLKGSFGGTGVVTTAKVLAAGARYEIFVSRDSDSSQIRVTDVAAGSYTDASGTVDHPAIFNYDKTLGFVIGDTVDQENSAPFTGQIRRFAFYNESALKWFPLTEAVLYYDINSLYGDQIIDRGNRILNAYAGTRVPSSPPFYSMGGFKGGSYIAATGGYTMAVSTPDINYVGELKRALKKDAVVQRRGSKAFLTSNRVNYLIDDFSKTFRPLGIPRPATKVSCTPQGVGVIDGFVRYAYRWITRDGTVGPAFGLDPVDARDGVNVFLGAEGFGLPGETPFGISFGEAEGYDSGDPGDTSDDTVETFIAKDTDGASTHNILRNERSFPGLTLEVAVRIPELDTVKESIFSQGVCGLPGAGGQWMSDEEPVEFPWIGNANQECTFQFAFRFDNGNFIPQVLFGIGAQNQHYTTGSVSSQDHYRLNHLIVSIQYAAVAANNRSIVICRDAPAGSDHRDDDLHHFAFDYDFQDSHDYCVFVRRAGINFGSTPGEDLVVSVYDHTLHGTDDGAGGTIDGWLLWPTPGVAEKIKPGFWGSNYNGDARDHVMWGASRHEGDALGAKTRKRSSNGAAFTYDKVQAMRNGTTAGNPIVPGTIMYHGRMWNKDWLLQVLAVKALDRYGARDGSPLAGNKQVDTAFCSDSSRSVLGGGWDHKRGVRTKFFMEDSGAFNAHVVLTESVDNSPILAYGWDMTVSPGSPDTWTTTSLSAVPLWITWSSRNSGSISIGVGSKPQIEIAEKKWHSTSKVMTFEELAGIIDLKQWTWITLYYHHMLRLGTQADVYDVWLERVFLDGNTGNWGETFAADITLNGIPTNASTGSGESAYGLFTVGGLPGMDQQYDVEIAEVRLWDGEYYAAAGGGTGDNAFGPHMSTRVPPNIWDTLWYYLRFMKIDVNDIDNQTRMDQFGLKENAAGVSHLSADAVTLYQGAEVKDGTEEEGASYFIPFPEPPMSAIRGIQIFRTQVVPVTETFPTGETNPNAIPEAWKACRDAPLYFLTEIPRGTGQYTDTAADAALGPQLDSQTGLIPRNPKGVFEWGGYLGVYVEDQPRIHFSESPSSWESFPLDMVYDIPVREYGPIEAAVELASRDARQSRVLCLGKSWGIFIDGSPTAPQANTLGGGVGASSSRCLVVEKGIAYAYNGTLWGITGDGQVEDLGLPVLDLLPDPASTRLSVSSALSSVFVINEDTGLALRFHLARRQWFVEDRYALSVTDVDGVDTWVHVSGYPSTGDTTVYQDDVESNTPETGIVATEIDNAANTFKVATTGLKIGQRGVLVGDASATAADRNPYFRQAITIQSISGGTVTVEEDLDLETTFTPLGSSTPLTLAYNFYAGVGYWGTMIDTGQFNLSGDLNYVDVGVERGDGWWATFDSSDFAKDPTDRTGFASPESQPVNIVDVGGGGGSARWGLANRQRLERVIIYSTKPTDGSGSGVGLTELELSYTPDQMES